MEYHSTDWWWTHSKSNAPKNAGIPNNDVSSVPEPVFCIYIVLSGCHRLTHQWLVSYAWRWSELLAYRILWFSRQGRPVSSFSLISRISTLFCWNLNSYVLYWHSNVMNWPPLEAQRAINDGKLVQWFLRNFNRSLYVGHEICVRESFHVSSALQPIMTFMRRFEFMVASV